MLLYLLLFAPYIANDRPLYAKYKNQTLYPLLQNTRTDSIIDPTTNSRSITIWYYWLEQLNLEKLLATYSIFSGDMDDIIEIMLPQVETKI